MAGCLDKLYESIENLSETYMQPNQDKDSVLNPKSSTCASKIPLLLSHHESKTRKFYTCSTPTNTNTHGTFSPSTNPAFRSTPSGSVPSLFGGVGSISNNHYNVSDAPNVLCPQCNKFMSREMSYVSPAASNTKAVAEGGFVKGVVTYMVMDDLEVTPLSTISGITFLNKFNVKDLGALEERVVDFRMEEGLKLLKAPIECKNVLTSIFF